MKRFAGSGCTFAKDRIDSPCSKDCRSQGFRLQGWSARPRRFWSWGFENLTLGPAALELSVGWNSKGSAIRVSDERDVTLTTGPRP